MLSTSSGAEDLVNGFESGGSRSGSHFLAFEPIVKFLGLLMLAALFPKGRNQIGVLSLQLVLVHLHHYAVYQAKERETMAGANLKASGLNSRSQNWRR